MAIITTPAAFKIRAASWTLHRPAQMTRSGYTGRRQVVAAPWHGRVSGNLELAPLEEADARAVQAFVAELQGQVHTARIEAVASPQTDAVSISTSAGASAGATQISVTGGGILTPGMKITVADQLLFVTAATSTTVSFQPQLRASISSGTTVLTRLPTALVALASPDVSWTVDLGPIYHFAFDVEEAF
jgi:hypothetical protein